MNLLISGGEVSVRRGIAQFGKPLPDFSRAEMADGVKYGEALFAEAARFGDVTPRDGSLRQTKQRLADQMLVKVALAIQRSVDLRYSSLSPPAHNSFIFS